MPPSHFSNFMVHFGTIIMFMPVGVVWPAPIMPVEPIPVIDIPVVSFIIIVVILKYSLVVETKRSQGQSQ
jgi:hypothetical protein